jgi:hypothetical protein
MTLLKKGLSGEKLDFFTPDHDNLISKKSGFFQGTH